MKKHVIATIALITCGLAQPAFCGTLEQEQLDSDFELKKIYFGIDYPWQMLEPWDEAMIRLYKSTGNQDLTASEKTKKKLAAGTGKKARKKKSAEISL